MKTIRFLAFTASLLLAIAFTFSCSKDEESDEPTGGGEGGITVVVEFPYTKTDNAFTYTTTNEHHVCKEGGTLEKESENETSTISYSIDGNTLFLDIDGNGKTISFSGNSTDLVGTWTRTRNECEPSPLRPDKEKYCVDNNSLVKAEFTTNTFEFTYDYCPTEQSVSGFVNENGVKSTVIDCNTLELSKGTDKMTLKFNAKGHFEFTYNGKTCSQSTYYTETKAEQACKKAWDEHGGENPWRQDYYYDYLDEEMNNCLQGFPIFLFPI
jgi:hypothetical protein